MTNANILVLSKVIPHSRLLLLTQSYLFYTISKSTNLTTMNTFLVTQTLNKQKQVTFRTYFKIDFQMHYTIREEKT